VRRIEPVVLSSDVVHVQFGCAGKTAGGVHLLKGLNGAGASADAFGLAAVAVGGGDAGAGVGTAATGGAFVGGAEAVGAGAVAGETVTVVVLGAVGLGLAEGTTVVASGMEEVSVKTATRSLPSLAQPIGLCRYP